MTIFTNFGKIDNFWPVGQPELSQPEPGLSSAWVHRVSIQVGPNPNPDFFSRVEPELTFNPAQPVRVALLIVPNFETGYILSNGKYHWRRQRVERNCMSNVPSCCFEVPSCGYLLLKLSLSIRLVLTMPSVIIFFFLIIR